MFRANKFNLNEILDWQGSHSPAPDWFKGFHAAIDNALWIIARCIGGFRISPIRFADD
jgi:hypothetical protein